MLRKVHASDLNRAGEVRLMAGLDGGNALPGFGAAEERDAYVAMEL